MANKKSNNLSLAADKRWQSNKIFLFVLFKNSLTQLFAQSPDLTNSWKRKQRKTWLKGQNLKVWLWLTA